MVCRLARLKFGAETAEGLSKFLKGITDPERIARIGDRIIECDTGAELLAHARDDLSELPSLLYQREQSVFEVNLAAASSRLLDDRHGSRDQEPPEGSRWPILDILPSLGLHQREQSVFEVNRDGRRIE